MQFITDKQTLEDLNITGKYKAGSLFNLFNRVRTRGGELLLEAMFQSPLTDPAAINERSSRIRYCQQTGITLDIDMESIAQTAQYIRESPPHSMLESMLTTWKSKLDQMLFHSDRYSALERSIAAVKNVLTAARHLYERLNAIQGYENSCAGMQQRLSDIIDTPALKKIRESPSSSIYRLAASRFITQRNTALIDELLILLYEFDVYITVGKVAESNALAYATAIDAADDDLLEVTDLRHPSLQQAVGNGITLTRDKNVLFLTGANMAGKSTWMKTLGTSFYLAHMGFPVAADKMRFSVMEGILTSINVPDDLNEGWSHFYAEVIRVKRVAREVSAGRRLFVLFDELFKGTNVKDAYDATLAVSLRLAKYRNCRYVISTHIIEVAHDLGANANIQFGYMPTIMEGKAPRYTYKLTAGISADRQGMIIIENEGILELLD